MSADPGDGRNNSQCNTRGDEAIFNGRGGQLVLKECNELPEHCYL